MANPVPNFPEFKKGVSEGRIPEMLRRMWELSQRTGDLSAVGMSADFGEAGLRFLGPEQNGFWARVTENQGDAKYSIQELQDDTLGQLDNKDDGVFGTITNGLYAQEVNNNHGVPVGTIVHCYLGDTGDHWEFEYEPMIAGGGAGNGGGAVSGGAGGGAIVVTFPTDGPGLPTGTIREITNPDTGVSVLVMWNGTEWVVVGVSTGSGGNSDTSMLDYSLVDLVSKVCPSLTSHGNTSGDDVLGTNYSIANDDTWENVNDGADLSVTLPTTGNYLLSAQVIGEGEISAGTSGTIDCRLYDSTAAASVPGSLLEIVKVPVLDTLTRDRATHAPVPYAAPVANTVIKLQAYRDTGPTWTSADIIARANGGTRLMYQRSVDSVVQTGSIVEYTRWLVLNAVQTTRDCDTNPTNCCNNTDSISGCCENFDLPLTLPGAFDLPVPEGCNNCDGFIFEDTLTWNDDSGYWIASGEAATNCDANYDYSVTLECTGSDCESKRLTVALTSTDTVIGADCDTIYTYEQADTLNCTCDTPWFTFNIDEVQIGTNPCDCDAIPLTLHGVFATPPIETMDCSCGGYFFETDLVFNIVSGKWEATSPGPIASGCGDFTYVVTLECTGDPCAEKTLVIDVTNESNPSCPGYLDTIVGAASSPCSCSPVYLEFGSGPIAIITEP